MLAGVLDRDGEQHSATQTRRQALADADHLAILHAIWAAEITPARDQRYRDLLMNSLPPGYRWPPGHQAKWLWRTLRGAELAGLDPAAVLAGAVAERDLAGYRDIAAVIDARIRHRLGTLVPLPGRPWSEQVPALADPERQAYVAQIAALMDAPPHGPDRRAHRQPPPPWATAALGPVPARQPGSPGRNELRRSGAWRGLSGCSGIGLDGGFAEEELARDFAVRQAPGNLDEDLGFSGGEVGQRVCDDVVQLAGDPGIVRWSPPGRPGLRDRVPAFRRGLADLRHAAGARALSAPARRPGRRTARQAARSRYPARPVLP